MDSLSCAVTSRVAICIATYRRPDGLARLLAGDWVPAEVRSGTTLETRFLELTRDTPERDPES